MGQSDLKVMLTAIDALYRAMDPSNIPDRFPRDPDDLPPPYGEGDLDFELYDLEDEDDTENHTR